VYNSDPRFGSIITGIPGHTIKDLELNNIHIYYKGGGTAEQAAKQVPENEKNYPEPNMFGTMPSYGFYLRHVDGLKLRDVEVSFLSDDARPAFIFDDVKGLDSHNVKGQTIKGVDTFKYINTVH